MLTRGGARPNAPWRSTDAVATSGSSLVFHWGGPRHGEVDDVPAEWLVSAVLVYDGPRWYGVYERREPAQVRDTPQGPAEVWVVLE